MASKSKVSGVTASALGRHLDTSRQRIMQMVDEAIITTLPDGSFDQDACRIAVLRWLRSEERRAARTQAESRVRDARAREIELRIAEREGRLIDLEEAKSAVIEIVGAYRAELISLPAAATRDLPIRRKIQDLLDGALERANRKIERFAEVAKEGAE